MRYADFVHIMSSARMSRYLTACSNSTRKAMTLYRLNLRLSQELFTVISCFEISLRNSINNHFLAGLGNDWLRHGGAPGGVFANNNCRLTRANINEAINKLNHSYTHNKLVAELGFGFWRYMFAANQYTATGRTLLRIFPAKPTSTPAVQYNQTFVFNQLALINNLRNRIAHHQPVCFQTGNAIKDTRYVRQHYGLIKQLFQWMTIDESALLYGLDNINSVCNRIDDL
jgi:hypothetical protein